MGRTVFFQNHVLNNSWQQEVVYKTLRSLTEKCGKRIVVVSNATDLKNLLLSNENMKEMVPLVRKLFIGVDENTRTISLNLKDHGEMIVLIVNPYMFLFDKSILRMECSKENIRNIIMSTRELYKDVIVKDIGLEEQKEEPEDSTGNLLNDICKFIYEKFFEK